MLPRLTALGVTGSRWALALSGGPDSTALLLLLAPLNPQLTVLIVDHALRPESAAEAQQAAFVAQELGLTARILTWEGAKPASGLMAAARQARYGLLLEACYQLGLTHLFLAHHADDQAETLRLRQEAQSGWRGLAGMPWLSRRYGVQLVRPLLDLSKGQLEDICTQSQVPIIRDPSNANPRFTRARLRLTPQEPPACTAARRQAELETLKVEQGQSFTLHTGYARLLTAAPREGLLRVLLAQVGQQAYPPTEAALARAQQNLERGQGFTLAGCRVTPRQEHWLLVREAAGMSRLEIAPESPHFWYDRRWRVAPPGATGQQIGPLARGPWRHLAQAALLEALPAPVREGWPVWGQGEQVVAVADVQPCLATEPLADVFDPKGFSGAPLPAVF